MVSEHNHQKKIALINDITGFGRCSVAVELPIISMMKVQCCVIPTAILSNHTGFNSFFFDDYTSKMESYIEQWKKLNLAFNGICSGFLGSQSQISIVSDFIRDFSDKETVVVVDPVMGDNGRKYSTYTDEMCDMMKQLAGQAHILTPNLTEACILTDTEYTENWHEKEIEILGEKLLSLGPEKIVITGIQQGSFIANYCCTENEKGCYIKVKKAGQQRSGTGDIFTSIIAADAVNGVDFYSSVRKASQFIKQCIIQSDKMDIPLTDGVCFEEILRTLK